MKAYFKRWSALPGLLVCVFILFNAPAHASHKTDSLKAVLNYSLPDSQKIDILINLASELPCEDTISKIKYIEEAEAISYKTQWYKGEIKAEVALGNIYSRCTNDYPHALVYFLRANTLAVAAKDKHNEITSLRQLAFCYKYMGQYGLAMDYYRQELALNPDADETTGIWGDLGATYNSIGDYNRSISAYFNSLKALQSAQSMKKRPDWQDTLQMAGLLLNIGDVYLAMSENDKALKNYDSVYKTGVAIKNRRLEIIGLMGIGKVYKKENNYEQSIILYQRALKECSGQNDITDQVEILNQLANAYLGKRDLAAAIDNARQSLSLAQSQARYEQLPKVYTTIGEIYLQAGNYNSAADNLQKALDISHKTGARDDEKEAWYALSNTYEKMDQEGKALGAYKQYITIRDSIYSVDKANEFMRQELDYLYKNEQLAEKLTYDKKIAGQKVLIYSGFALLVLVLLLAFFIYRNYNTQRKYNELLSREQEKQLARIEAQDTVLTDIAYIQSHEVRGPVATILGLLQLYNYQDPADPVNKEIMEGLSEVTEQLDVVVKEVIFMENNLKRKQGRTERKNRI